MGVNNGAPIMTLANSIIGVSILAMPYCFKQCGIVLASLILILSSIMTRLACHYLLKSAIMSRRRNFEILAFHVFGSTGKLCVELSIIFLMIGTCIAFFVVMGDLGPEIIATLLNFNSSTALRPSVLIGLAVCVVLPLGLLRNVDSLSSICTASFIFYICLVSKVLIESTDNLLSGDWLKDANLWRPAGILQCLPIFSMALSCQTQLFEVFDSVANATLDRMNAIVKSAIHLCTLLYIGVGFFGYIAYYKQNISGNLLMNFTNGISSDVIKLGFVLSVAVTFPLVIFPCRAALNSLLFRKAHVPHYELVTGAGTHIPEARFRCITLFIITISLTIGLIAPNIEIVLGLLGSTIGVIILILFPPLIFIRITPKATTERFLAQIMVACGIFIMVMGTYANLYLAENSNSKVQTNIIANDFKPLDTVAVPPAVIDKHPVADSLKNEKEISENKNPEPIKISSEKMADIQNAEIKKKENLKEPDVDKRKEPPIPIAPEGQSKNSENNSPDLKNKQNNNAALENNEKMLLKTQKEVLQQLREEKKLLKDSKGNQIKEEPVLEKNADNMKKKVENLPLVLDKKDQMPDEKVAAEIMSKNVEVENKNSNISNLMKESVPLPILKNQNLKNLETDEKKDILPEPPIQREKRDLEFVSLSIPKVSIQKGNDSIYDEKVSVEKEKISIIENKDTQNSFMNEIIISKDQIKKCDTRNDTNIDTQNNITKSSDNKNLPKIVKTENVLLKNEDFEKSKQIELIQKIENDKSLKNSVSDPGENFILSSAKLLHSINDKNFENLIVADIKPMIRDLKSVDKSKTIDETRK